ncbi:MAG: alpha-ketoacid dehydrogenase subunit beta [Gammaproteobacteria bacterium]|nr:alpha-ketoacid dehydrogenase subunit beta [Gammaproteobacteria bacterium]
MTMITIVEAVNRALAYELEADPSVVLLGEDIGVNGGVFRATDGLQAQFGKTRVIDTPLAEIAISGVSVGLATQGLKPVSEIQFMGFIYATMEQLISHAARMRNRTRGRLTCPMVVRAPYGAGIHAPEHHSESTEALFVHIPGLKVVIPSTPRRTYGLLLAAIRDPDPVIFLEPERIYRLIKQDVEEDGVALPLEKCFIEREGSDLTLISWGASMHEARQAVASLEAKGVGVDLIDVATLSPLDSETILASVEKTGRCLIVHEAPKTGGMGAEIAARICEKALLSLKAPVKRVTGYDIIVPLYKLEKHYLPSVKVILQAAQEILEFA